MKWLIPVAIILGVIFMIVRRGLQMKNLAHHGVVGQARVEKKFSRQSGSGGMSATYLRYEFHGPDGQLYSNKISVSLEIYEQYEENDSIDIVYLEDKPGVNAARYMVNLSREALKLPPL